MLERERPLFYTHVMQGLRLYKAEKLCSRTAIEQVFAQGRGTIAYPLRAVYDFGAEGEAPAQILISIPKKKIRPAVRRVLLRRRVREAYRLLRRSALHPALQQGRVTAHIAFVYLANEVVDYHVIEAKMSTLLARIAQDAASRQSTASPCE